MKLFQASEGLAELPGVPHWGQENLGWDVCGLVFGDCFTVGCWANVGSCEAVLGRLFGRSSKAGGLSDRVVSFTVVS